MSATFNFEGADQNGTDVGSATPFTIGGSGSQISVTQSRDWTVGVGSSPIPAGSSSIERLIRAAFSGTFNSITVVKVWRSDSNSLNTGVGIKLGGLPSGVAWAVPSTTTNGDSAIPTSEPGSSNLNVDSSGATRYAPPLSGGASRWMRIQIDTTGSSPAGNISSGSPNAQLTVKYTES